MIKSQSNPYSTEKPNASNCYRGRSNCRHSTSQTKCLGAPYGLQAIQSITNIIWHINRNPRGLDS